MQFEENKGKSGTRVLLFKARFFTTVNINCKHFCQMEKNKNVV